jgi:endonuclease-3
MTQKIDAGRIVRLLAQVYGMPLWSSDGDPLSVLVRTVLSQHTSDVNSDRAFEQLTRTFPDWEDVLLTDEARIAEAIRAGGLANIKSKRIVQILRKIKDRRGSLDLGFLERMPIEEAREWLKGLPGVGDKTAACVLLFALGRPDLPADTHILRVSRRLGLVGKAESPAAAHIHLREAVPEPERYAFHVLMIEHGRTTCKPRLPRCGDCVLAESCPSRIVTG